MRDLSRISLPVNNSKKTHMKYLIIFGFLILIVGIVIVINSKFSFGSGSGSTVMLREAPRGLEPVGVERTTSVIDGGVELASQSATLTDVKYSGQASATAKRSFASGVYILNVEATLPDPKNTNYQVWLVGGGKIVPIDYMRGSKTKWSLSLRDINKYSEYDGIWITLERSKDDLPEEHVLEGSF